MRGARCLVVEDEAILAEDLAEQLRGLGYTVAGLTDSGEEAVRQAGSARPDLVLMDIRLRGKMDGVAAASLIRKFHRVPVVFLTAYADPATLARAKLAQPFGYIHKPCHEDDLRAAIEVALHKHRAEHKLKKSEERYRTAFRESEEQVRLLLHRLVESQETERRYLAAELHDEIGQLLTTISLNLKAIEEDGHAGSGPRVAESIGMVDRAIEQVRSLSLELRPAMLDLLGLDATLRWYVDRQAQRSGLAIRFTSALADRRFSPALETAGFRVVQEALTNVVRHARARHVHILLSLLDDGLQLTVRDDGIGFDVAAVRERAARGGSFGLLGMAERVQFLGGRIDVDSSPAEHGTTIRVWLPPENPGA